MTDQDSLYRDLIQQFNLKSTDTVLLSSDVTRLALFFKANNCSFSVDRFIDLLAEVLIDGTIIIPAYTDNLKNGDVFDPEKSKPTTGSLSNRVMRRKDFFRTTDPLHSVFVKGKNATEILELSDQSTFGENSIFGYLDRVKAKMIIIDVHFDNSFTFVHFIEEKLRVTFRKPFYWKMKVKEKDGFREKEVLFYTKKMGYTVSLQNLQQSLIDEGLVSKKSYSGVEIMTMDLDKVGDFTEQFIESGGKTYGFSFSIFIRQFIKKLIRKG